MSQTGEAFEKLVAVMRTLRSPEGCPWDRLRRVLPNRFRALRREAQAAGGHRREPGQVAHLLLGLEAFLGFAVEIGALAPADRDARLRDARGVLLAHALEHAEAQAEEAPERLFLRLLGDGFAAKRAYLEAKGGGEPADAERWGWEAIVRPDRDGIDREEPAPPPGGAARRRPRRRLGAALPGGGLPVRRRGRPPFRPGLPGRPDDAGPKAGRGGADRDRDRGGQPAIEGQRAG